MAEPDRHPRRRPAPAPAPARNTGHAGQVPAPARRRDDRQPVPPDPRRSDRSDPDRHRTHHQEAAGDPRHRPRSPAGLSTRAPDQRPATSPAARTATRSAAVRPLPIRPRPAAGDTPATYIRRLARANHLRPGYLNRYLRDDATSQISIDMRAAQPATPQTAQARPSRLDPCTAIIDAILDEELRHPGRPAHTIRQILNHLITEHNATGISYGLVRQYIGGQRSLRPRPHRAAAASATPPADTAPSRPDLAPARCPPRTHRPRTARRPPPRRHDRAAPRPRRRPAPPPQRHIHRDRSRASRALARSRSHPCMEARHPGTDLGPASVRPGG